MPTVGETKTLVYELSKRDIQTQLNLSQAITNSVVSEFIKYAAGFGAGILGGFWAGGAVVVGTSELINSMQQHESTIKANLELIKANNGKGIRVSQPMRYSYYSGSGTGWNNAGSATTTVYLIYCCITSNKILTINNT